jgi:hypothetical protein
VFSGVLVFAFLCGLFLERNTTPISLLFFLLVGVGYIVLVMTSTGWNDRNIYGSLNVGVIVFLSSFILWVIYHVFVDAIWHIGPPTHLLPTALVVLVPGLLNLVLLRMWTESVFARAVALVCVSVILIPYLSPMHVANEEFIARVLAFCLVYFERLIVYVVYQHQKKPDIRIDWFKQLAGSTWVLSLPEWFVLFALLPIGVYGSVLLRSYYKFDAKHESSQTQPPMPPLPSVRMTVPQQPQGQPALSVQLPLPVQPKSHPQQPIFPIILQQQQPPKQPPLQPPPQPQPKQQLPLISLPPL